MTIEIKCPEIEALIQQRLHSGGFESVEDVLFDALEMQREREAWLLENKDAIDATIEPGLAQLQRGLNCALVWQRIKQPGLRTTLIGEGLPCLTGNGE
jgi:hypothetical protein